jgi:D-methionine transport system substrate-binding protein
MKKSLLAILLLCFALVGCNKSANTNNAGAEAEAGGDDNKIVIGVSPVPHGEIINGLSEQFKEAGLDVEVVVFDDYIQPNEQLAAGDIDANYFQHGPYLKDFCEQNKLDLVSIGNVHIEPIALYSDKIKDISELKDGDEIIIPNDPSNGGRALILLDKIGIIKLKDNTNLLSTENDIAENPNNIKIVPMEAQNIPNTYTDAAAAVINSNYAIGAGLNPNTDALVMEDIDSPYANLVAVRKGDENKEKFKKLMEVLHSEDCKKFI